MAGVKELTEKQKRYCENRALKGMSKAGSYRAAGYASNKNKQIDSNNAITLEKQAHIKERINYLNNLAAKGMILNRDQIAAKLTDMSLDDSKPDGIQLKALDQLSKVTGVYADSGNLVVNQININDKHSAIIDSLQFD